ncbi:MAG TPA: CoA-transferase [Syntrophaceae bacterium]|jgi:glutaconate CoA-transferase subunit A|nr:CoA-transferase [Syntrophaceae bacterium]
MEANKMVSLKDAVSVIQDGDIVFFGGIVDGRRPVAAMRELARQQKKNLITLSFLSVEDFLVGAGCIKGIRGCYTHLGIFGKVPCLHRALAKNELVVDEFGHIDCQLQLMAPALGLPYVASPYCIGSDIINPNYDFSEKLRALAREPERIGAQKYIFTENPFSPEHETVVLVPALRPNVAIIHAGKIGHEGTVRIEGTQGLDIYAAFAADRVIVTAEEIVPESYLRRDPNRNNIPTTQVDMIVHVPWGAHPTALPGYYDMDMEALFIYQKAARTEEDFAKWSDEWIYSLSDNNAYLEKIGAAKMMQLKAVEPYGFKPRTSVEQLG